MKGFEAEQAYQNKIEQYKVPLYRDPKLGKKADNSVRLMFINVNYLSMWKRYNYKAKRLRWAMFNYKIESMGIQEVGVNWRNFKTSNTLASLLRQGSNPIRSVNSFSRLDTKNIDNTQRGSIATVTKTH